MGRLLLTVLRVGVGLVIVDTGLGFTSHDFSHLSLSEFESFISAVFIVSIGLQIIFSSIKSQFFED